MDEPKALDSLFKQKIFRIPDYQRGYAWQTEQLKAFWDDLVNLAEGRSHYTGVLTLKQVGVSPREKEHWLSEDHAYHVYHLVDGQQRLTTFVILLQALVECIRSLPEFRGKPDAEIFVTDSLSLRDLTDTYLFKTKPTGDRFRTYKFGYTADNPSYEYLRYRILGEDGSGQVQETFYTLNLSNAKTYFAEQFAFLYQRERLEGLQRLFKTLTKRFLFNEYVIQDEFDVFVAFETMNNRGKKLSDLELLKNRLIYLTTLYTTEELDEADSHSLRDGINDAWKEVYHQLGRNKIKPLNDNEFLRAHWIMYFKYSRKTGKDYIRFLLDEQFTPKRIRTKPERDVSLQEPTEIRSDTLLEEPDEENEDTVEETKRTSLGHLSPVEIRDYVNSLKESAVHWFNSYNPHLAEGLTGVEQQWIDRLNRIGINYFRPLVMAILKNEPGTEKRVRVFQGIERFIFIAFRLNAYMATYRSSEFYNAAREFDRHETDIETICAQLKDRLAFTFHEDGSFRPDEFYNALRKRFEGGTGYYTWRALRYFLFEYELSLLSGSRQKKVDWDDLLKSERDTVSIEHIYPQTETLEWAARFAGISPESRKRYSATLGNLLILSQAINSSLQNDSFEDKKMPKFSTSGIKLRNGYADGSHSEIEVAQSESWGPEQLKDRAIKLLKFMETRWEFRFKDDGDRERLLFLDPAKD
jgi:uncharacterized protein DUF262/uncharacterized protein DUF1524